MVGVKNMPAYYSLQYKPVLWSPTERSLNQGSGCRPNDLPPIWLVSFSYLSFRVLFLLAFLFMSPNVLWASVCTILGILLGTLCLLLASIALYPESWQHLLLIFSPLSPTYFSPGAQLIFPGGPSLPSHNPDICPILVGGFQGWVWMASNWHIRQPMLPPHNPGICPILVGGFQGGDRLAL